jgi:hypothetical protein
MFEVEGATWGVPDPGFGGDYLPANKTTLVEVLTDTGAPCGFSRVVATVSAISVSSVLP